jgi:hypothetical protein
VCQSLKLMPLKKPFTDINNGVCVFVHLHVHVCTCWEVVGWYHNHAYAAVDHLFCVSCHRKQTKSIRYVLVVTLKEKY